MVLIWACETTRGNLPENTYPTDRGRKRERDRQTNRDLSGHILYQQDLPVYCGTEKRLDKAQPSQSISIPPYHIKKSLPSSPFPSFSLPPSLSASPAVSYQQEAKWSHYINTQNHGALCSSVAHVVPSLWVKLDLLQGHSTTIIRPCSTPSTHVGSSQHQRSGPLPPSFSMTLTRITSGFNVFLYI